MTSAELRMALNPVYFPEAFYRAVGDVSYPLFASRVIAQAVIQGGAKTKGEVAKWVEENARVLGLRKGDVKRIEKVLQNIPDEVLSRIEAEWVKLTAK